jgi:NAD(P)H-flavin reductase
MLPFSLFPTSKVTDKVTLYQDNPRFDDAFYKDNFQIRSTEYTRCAVVVTLNSKKGRKGYLERKGLETVHLLLPLRGGRI